MKHLKTRVEWPELRDWLRAHGAKNDRIQSIRIDGNARDGFNVILTGHEENADGKAFLESRHDVAEWRSVNQLWYLP